MNPFRIPVVIADDHPLYRRALSAILKTIPGIGDIFLASNGKEALDLVRAQNPGLAIFDLNMPFMSGLEVIERLKYEFPKIQVMVLSMRNDLATLRTAIQLGTSSFLPKESEVDEIEHAVQAVLHDQFYFPLVIVQRLALERLKKSKTNLFSDAEWEMLEQMALQRTIDQIADKQKKTLLEASQMYKSVLQKAVMNEPFPNDRIIDLHPVSPETVT